MNGQDALDFLKNLCRNGESKQRGASLKRALLCVAIPATAGLATACYGVPMGDSAWDIGTPEPEVCNNTIDDDGDGATDCDDSDCERLELCLGCNDGIDNDGNGQSDCSDPTCADLELCALPGACADEADNDSDGWIDCEDPDCSGIDECI